VFGIMLNRYNKAVRLIESYSSSKPVITLKDKLFMCVLLLLACLFAMNMVIYTQTIY